MEYKKNFPGGDQSEGDLEKVEKSRSKQEKQHNKILMGFIFIVIMVATGIAFWSFTGNNNPHFEYNGVGFDIVDEIAPYRTEIPVTVNSGITGAATARQTQYYFYLRNDPRELDKIEFKGELKLLENVAIQSEKDFKCEGYGIVGATNLATLYNVLGIKIVQDPTATCDPEARYAVWNFIEGEKTEIEEISPGCYEIRIHDCEILQAQERLMVETFVEFDKIKDKVNIEI